MPLATRRGFSQFLSSLQHPKFVLSGRANSPVPTSHIPPWFSSVSARFAHSSSAKSNTMAAEKTAEWESQIKRNPHPDFKKVEASRPPFDTASTFHHTQAPQPSWTLGQGANTPPSPSARHVSIDPFESGRPAGFNYKLLISAIVPRPIAFISTRSADGRSTNLAPFSYFQMVCHDPPMFAVGFASALSPEDRCKDTLRNLAATRECVVNIVSEHFAEAANSTSVNAPYGVSEWDVSGLTPAYDCATVACARVHEAVFSVEATLDSLREFESRSAPGSKSGTLALVQGTRFWVREDALNEERNLVDPAVS